jgi:hypothetical protein
LHGENSKRALKLKVDRNWLPKKECGAESSIPSTLAIFGYAKNDHAKIQDDEDFWKDVICLHLCSWSYCQDICGWESNSVKRWGPRHRFRNNL